MVVDPYLSQQLRPHQRSGVLFLYSRLLGFTKVQGLAGEEQTVEGAILADEMGLGKTVQSLSMLAHIAEQVRLLNSNTIFNYDFYFCLGFSEFLHNFACTHF